MVQYSQAHLDASLAALADRTRRGVLEQLGRSESSITEPRPLGKARRSRLKPTIRPPFTTIPPA